jgi:hypothetical protein
LRERQRQRDSAKGEGGESQTYVRALQHRQQLVHLVVLLDRPLLRMLLLLLRRNWRAAAAGKDAHQVAHLRARLTAHRRRRHLLG